MKYPISLVVCIFCIMKLYGQETFPITFHSPLNEKILDISEKDGSIIGVGQQNIDDYQYSTSKGIIWKIDQQLDTISKTFHFSDTSAYFRNIFTSPSGFDIYGTSFYPPNYSISGFFKLSLDNDLNVLSLTNIDPSNSHFKWLGFVQKIEDYIYCFGKEIDSLGQTFQTITKVDSLGSVVDKYSLLKETGQFVDCLLSPDSTQLWVFAIGMVNGNDCIMIFDSTLNLISSKRFPYKMNYQTLEIEVSYDDNLNVSWYTDSTFLVGCNHIRTYQRGAPHVEYDFGFSILDSSMSLKPIEYIGLYDIVESAGAMTNHNYITLDSIYYCGTKNNIIEFFPTLPSWIIAGKFDRNLNKIYERYYGGDANYKTMVIKALSYGGSVIGAIRYDHLSQGYEWDVTFLKLDADGFITSVSENSIKQSFVIYPNPVSDVCQINTEQPGFLFIMDMCGRIIKTMAIDNGTEQIDLHSLEPSVYNFIFKSKSIVSSQKIIII